MPRRSKLFTLGYGNEDSEETESYSVQGAGKFPANHSLQQHSGGEPVGKIVYDHQNKGLKIIIDTDLPETKIPD